MSNPAERRENATLILSQICASSAFQPYLKQLFCAKDTQGQTPFMLAVPSRAHQAGKNLLNVIKQVSNGDSNLCDAMNLPPGPSPDQSPLSVLCCNDTCSFTWTGADHINQDIFECKTCSLTGSLCCCTECAWVCHKGHGYKLKKTPPTAYCDCCKKCKWKALVAGNQKERFQPLKKSVAETDLVRRVNSRNEPILLFLIQSVGRQINQQRQYRSSTQNTTVNRRTLLLETKNGIADHELEAPRFAKKTLEHMLTDWNAIKAMIMTTADQDLVSISSSNNNHFDEEDRNASLQSQIGTTLMGKFTHSLFVIRAVEIQNTSSGNHQSHLASQSMQWAIRNRDTPRSSVRLAR